VETNAGFGPGPGAASGSREAFQQGGNIARGVSTGAVLLPTALEKIFALARIDAIASSSLGASCRGGVLPPRPGLARQI